jgi:hypothetical protein
MRRSASRFGQGAEDHDLVHPIEELRPELASQRVENPLAHLLIAALVRPP